MQINISDKFATTCSPVIDSNYDTCGTLSMASIDHLSKEDLDSLFRPGGKWADLEAWLTHQIEMKACGVKLNAWYDWIMANADHRMFRSALSPGVKVVKGPDEYQPFIKGRQETVINKDYWAMEGSIRTADYTPAVGNAAISVMTSGPLAATTGGRAVIRVTSRHNIPMDAAWFRPGVVIHLFTTTNGVSQVGSWKIVDAAVDTPMSYIDVLVTDAAPAGETGSPTGMNTSSGNANDHYFDVATTGASTKKGLIIQGVNNVNDYERWCHNPASVNPYKMVPFWLQTYRDTRCVDEEYRQIFARLTASNSAFREFGDLPLAQLNKQAEADAQTRFVHAFFFGRPISSNQTLTNWEKLEDIKTITETNLTPGIGDKVKAKRANWEGVRYQLMRCDRVRDMGKAPLNLIEFFHENYRIMRARKSQGRNVKGIDWFTNAQYRDAFRSAMLDYYKTFYKEMLRFVIEPTKQNVLGMVYDTYRVGYPGGIDINIFSDEFFDDWRSENESLGQVEMGNLLLALDIGKPGTGTIYYANIENNRKMYKTASVEQLAAFDTVFQCVMKVSSKELTLNSNTGSVIVECPLNSLFLENLSTAPPITTGLSLNPYYENLL